MQELNTPIPTDKSSKKDETFDWHNPNIPEIMKNSKYSELSERRDQRRQKEMLLHDNENFTWDDILTMRQELVEEEVADETEHLQTDLEKRQYEVYTKYKTIYDLESKGALDPGMFEILYEFQRLPFRTHQSCSGHPESISDSISTEPKFVLSFAASPDVSSEEKEVQQQFITNFSKINKAICNQLFDGEFVDVFSPEGEFYIDASGNEAVFSPEESLELGIDIHMVLNLDYLAPALDLEMYKHVLYISWSEFIEYAHSFIPNNSWEPLDFEDGDVFFAFTT